VLSRKNATQKLTVAKIDFSSRRIKDSRRYFAIAFHTYVLVIIPSPERAQVNVECPYEEGIKRICTDPLRDYPFFLLSPDFSFRAKIDRILRIRELNLIVELLPIL